MSKQEHKGIGSLATSRSAFHPKNRLGSAAGDSNKFVYLRKYPEFNNFSNEPPDPAEI
jgi:hypothetical protein